YLYEPPGAVAAPKQLEIHRRVGLARDGAGNVAQVHAMVRPQRRVRQRGRTVTPFPVQISAERARRLGRRSRVTLLFRLLVSVRRDSPLQEVQIVTPALGEGRTIATREQSQRAFHLVRFTSVLQRFAQRAVPPV